MNKKEAKEILIKVLNELQTRSIADLQVYIESLEVILRDGASGSSYQIEVETVWEDPRESGGDLRAVASIDDGGLISALLPLSSDFVLDSDGNIRVD